MIPQYDDPRYYVVNKRLNVEDFKPERLMEEIHGTLDSIKRLEMAINLGKVKSGREDIAKRTFNYLHQKVKYLKFVAISKGASPKLFAKHGLTGL